MLPHINRLSAKGDFARLFAKGKPVFAKGITLKLAKNGLEKTRIGFVVSTKVSKRAVVRNKVKRRLREAVRTHLDNLQPGWDMAFLTKPEIKDAEYVALAGTVDYLLKKAGVLSGSSVAKTTSN